MREGSLTIAYAANKGPVFDGRQVLACCLEGRHGLAQTSQAHSAHSACWQ